MSEGQYPLDNMKIRHGNILSTATGLTHKEVWEGLIDFVLFGKPEVPGTPMYQLYFCWQAVMRMQIGSRDLDEFTSWASPESTVAEVLGWSVKRVNQALFSHSQGSTSEESRLAKAVVRTVILCINHFDQAAEFVTSAQIDVKTHKKIEIYPNTWAWHVGSNQPAYVLKVYPSYLPPHTEAQTVVDVLLQIEGSQWHQITEGDGPVLETDEPEKWSTVFERRTVRLDDVTKILLELGELEY